jgi:hypothetical protein
VSAQLKAETPKTGTPKCNAQWHIFDGGLPKPNQRCQCGKKIGTNKIGIIVDAPQTKTQ